MNLNLDINRSINHILLKKNYLSKIVLIGGHSRVGKSLFAKILKEKIESRGFRAMNISMDLWLKPLKKRKPNSTVIERHRTNECQNAIDSLLKGRAIKFNSYNFITRNYDIIPKKIRPPTSPYILIVDGVVTLMNNYLRSKSILNIYIQTNNFIRLKRLIRFYRSVKNIDRNTYKKIFKKRESEEINFINKSKKYADLLVLN